MSHLAFTLPALKPEKCHPGASGQVIVDLGDGF